MLGEPGQPGHRATSRLRHLRGVRRASPRRSPRDRPPSQLTHLTCRARERLSLTGLAVAFIGEPGTCAAALAIIGECVPPRHRVRPSLQQREVHNEVCRGRASTGAVPGSCQQPLGAGRQPARMVNRRWALRPTTTRSTTPAATGPKNSRYPTKPACSSTGSQSGRKSFGGGNGRSLGPASC